MNFVIKQRGEDRIVVWDSGGCRPASIAECVLWDRLARLVKASNAALCELKAIRARDGVPYCYDGRRSDVDTEYFSSVVDELDAATMEGGE